MKPIVVLMLVAGASPFAFGASKEIIELQRDVAQLQDQMRTLQRTLDERVGTLQALAQQALESSNRTNTAVAVMQDRINDALRQQQQAVSAPVANLGAKIDQMSEDFRAVRESVLDMNQRIGKLDAKLADLQNTVNVIRNPPAAPPPATGATGTPPLGADAAAAAPAVPPAGMSAETLQANAFRDYTSGKYDLALQEFSDYIKYYPTVQFAPNAQFYIGEIYFRKKDYENAIQAYDNVLEHYSDNPKTAEAHLKKGEALLALGRRDAAAREFRDILSHYPESEAVARAKTDLRQLGLSAATAPAPRRRTPAR